MFRRFWHCGFEYQSLSAACCSSRVNLRIKKSCTADSPSCKPVLRNIDSCFLKHEGRTQAILHHWGWRNQGLHMLVTAARGCNSQIQGPTRFDGTAWETILGFWAFTRKLSDHPPRPQIKSGRIQTILWVP